MGIKKDHKFFIYDAVADAVCNVRASTPLGADWSDEINADYQKRGKRSKK